jgi:integrase
MISYQVRIWDVTDRVMRGKKWYRLRWTVSGAPKPFEKLFEKKALANSERAKLMSAANAGKPFDVATGRPVEELRAENATTWYLHARAYIGQKWPRLSANSRRGTVEALRDITLLAVQPAKRGRPDDPTLRDALYLYAFNPRRWNEAVPREYASALEWVERASLSIVHFDSAATVRRVLDGLCILKDGTPAAAATVSRKRAAFYNAMGYAVELGHLDTNPIDRLQWTAPEVAQAVDRRVVPNPSQVAILLDTVRSLGKPADRVTAFFGCLYYAGTRPSEAADLRRADCVMPGTCLDCQAVLADVSATATGECQHKRIDYGWGRITLAQTSPRAGSHWTNDGQPNERRGLKHRARSETRSVPVPPQLVALLHHHIEKHDTAPDGRLFRGLHGGPLSASVYDRWWKMAREAALTPAQVASPLARRPYDLRHAAASLWLNAGVPATEVARRLGHSVAILLKVYVNCIDGGDTGLNDRIGDALG